jgi:hypothetical protein
LHLKRVAGERIIGRLRQGDVMANRRMIERDVDDLLAPLAP